jgi:GMP synthase PP-ATPase subunit
MQYCEEYDLEPEVVAPLVNRQLKDKLAVEFADMGLLKKQPSLYD